MKTAIRIGTCKFAHGTAKKIWIIGQGVDGFDPNGAEFDVEQEGIDDPVRVFVDSCLFGSLRMSPLDGDGNPRRIDLDNFVSKAKKLFEGHTLTPGMKVQALISIDADLKEGETVAVVGKLTGKIID